MEKSILYSIQRGQVLDLEPVDPQNLVSLSETCFPHGRPKPLHSVVEPRLAPGVNLLSPALDLGVHRVGVTPSHTNS